MKLYKYLIPILLVIQTPGVNGQTATSVTNGAWLSPFTWNCTCVPTPGYTVVINNQVSLNTSFNIPSGSITVNTGGSLIQDATPRDILVSGGTLTNHGKTQFRYLYLQTGSVLNTDSFTLKSFANYATITNTGTILKLDSFYNNGILTNSGTIQASKFFNMDSLLNDGYFVGVDSFYNNGRIRNNGSITTPTFYNNNTLNNFGNILGVDSLTNAGALHNYNTAVLNADSMWNPGTFINDGTIRNKAFLNTNSMVNSGFLSFIDAYNLGTFVNSDSMPGTHSFLNTGRFTNLSGGQLLLGWSFMNVDSVNHHAMFDNEGIVRVDSNWYNADTVRGVSGRFTVQFETDNGGLMLGSFDFCDLTPPAAAPFIDISTGSISPNVTWCSPVTTAIQDGLSGANLMLYPAITNDMVTLSITLPDMKNISWTVYDISGRAVIRKDKEYVSSLVQPIQVSFLASGMYIIRVSADDNFMERKFIKF